MIKKYMCNFFNSRFGFKGVCSEAVLKALRRVFPQVYESEHALIIDAKKVFNIILCTNTM